MTKFKIGDRVLTPERGLRDGLHGIIENINMLPGEMPIIVLYSVKIGDKFSELYISGLTLDVQYYRDQKLEKLLE